MQLGAGFPCLFCWLSAGLLPKTYCSNTVGTILGTEQWDWFCQQLHCQQKLQAQQQEQQQLSKSSSVTTTIASTEPDLKLYCTRI
jgi:hypothetical protein